MRRFKDPYLVVSFTSPQPRYNGDEVLCQRPGHRWLCTSNPHFNSNVERIMQQYDPFQWRPPVALDQVQAVIMTAEFNGQCIIHRSAAST